MKHKGDALYLRKAECRFNRQIKIVNMCVRFVLVSSVAEMERKFNVVANVDSYPKNYNIGVEQESLIICSDNPKKMVLAQFGYRPAHDENKQILNTRASSMLKELEWKQAYTYRRCLIPASCFYQGPQKEKLEKPYVVYLQDTPRPFAFAGVYRDVVSYNGQFRTFSIITTHASKVISKIGFHRAPVILYPDDYEKWLDNSRHLSQFTALLDRNENDKMNAYPVSQAVQNKKLNSKELVNPIGQRLIPEYNIITNQYVKLEGMGRRKR